MLIPVFLPFNMLKAGLNAAMTILLYKPIVVGLRRTGFLPPSTAAGGAKRSVNTGALLFGILLLATSVLLLLVFMGII